MLNYCRVILLGVWISLGVLAHAEPPGTLEEIEERFADQWAVCTTGDCATSSVVSTSVRSGKEVYQTYCMACHGSGVAGAPVYGSKEDWKPLVKLGRSHLFSSIKQGKLPLMPPKGTCSNCSDEELENVLDYFLSAIK